MKKIFSIFLFTLFLLSVFPQATILVERKEKTQILERYYVLNSDKNIKHGEYTSYFRVFDKDLEKYKNALKYTGYYKNGKKDSLWTEYYSPYNKPKNIHHLRVILDGVKSKGYYKDDKKVGIWMTKKDEVIERYDYDNKKKLMPIIHVYPEYPQAAKEARIQGNVTYIYRMRKDCTVEIIEIKNNLSPAFDEAIKESLKKKEELIRLYCGECECEEDIQTVNYLFTL